MFATRASTVPSTDKPPCQRRRMPLSLRMFAAMIVMMGGASVLWIGIPACRQFVAIREIERLQGHVAAYERGPTWLRKRVGNAAMRGLDEVIHVDVSGTELTDEGLRYIEC